MELDTVLLMETVETALQSTLTAFSVVDSSLRLNLSLTSDKAHTSSLFLDLLRRGVPEGTNVRAKILEKSITTNCDKCGKVVPEKGGEICLVIEVDDEKSKCTDCAEDKDLKAHTEEIPESEEVSPPRRSTKIHVQGADVCVIDSEGNEHHSLMDVEEDRENKKSLSETTKTDGEGGQEEAINLSCNLCKKTFKSHYTLKKHLKCHGNKPFKCKICRKEFPGKINFARHMKSHSHKCNICGKVYTRPLLLTTHMQSHQSSVEKDFSCKQCGKTFTALAYLSKHINRHGRSCHKVRTSKKEEKSPERRLYKCQICGEEYIIQAYLRKHMEDHTDAERKSCTMVRSRSRHKISDNEGIASKNNTDDGEEMQSTSRETQCEEDEYLEDEEDREIIEGVDVTDDDSVSSADVAGASPISIEEYEGVEHTAIKTEPDDICDDDEKETRVDKVNGETDCVADDLNEEDNNEEDDEYVQSHRKYIKILKKPPKIKPLKTKEYKCEICNISFTTQGYFHKHSKRIHSVGLVENTFSCDICGKAFASQENVDKHVKANCNFSESEKQRCNVCGKTLTNSVALERHMLHHTAKKTQMCELCGKCFLNQRCLKSHMIGHTEPLRHKCDICGRGYRNIWHMKVHRKTHTGENLHQCPDCKDWFANESYLNNQHRTKYCKGSQKCSCEICGREFLEHKSLQSHMGFHSGERPYMCDECGKSFAKIPNRDDHYKRHFQQLKFKCQHCDKGFKIAADLRKHVKRHKSLNGLHLKKYNLPQELKPKNVPQDVIITEQELDQATVILTGEAVDKGTVGTNTDTEIDMTDINTQELNITSVVEGISVTELPSLLSNGQMTVTLPSSHATNPGEQITVVLPSELAGCGQNISITEAGEIIMVAVEPDTET